MSRDNRRRAFSDVVAVDAWHDAFGKSTKVKLFTDVVFDTARLGGEIESNVRFRLSLRRAEVVVVIPEAEPIAVDKASVSRDAPEQTGKISKRTNRDRITNARASISANSFATSLRVKAAASLQADRSDHEQVTINEKFSPMTVIQSKTEDGHYRWVIEAREEKALRGRPWSASHKPRLKLIDRRNDITKGIAPTVRIEVRCRREDIEISDIEIKDERLWEKAKARAGFNNRLAAAESYIRERLIEDGLESRNIADKFGTLCFASVTAESP